MIRTDLKELKKELVEEHKPLSLKVENLYKFIHSEECDKLSKDMQYLLVEQYTFMKGYLKTLNYRIAYINEQIKRSSTK